MGNDISKTAQELITVRCTNGRPDWVQIDELVSEWEPGLLLIGLPLNMDGTDSSITNQARQFGQRLARRYRLNIEYEDERLSTSEADKILRGSLGSNQGLRKKQRSKRDPIAARLILESYFTRYA